MRSVLVGLVSLASVCVSHGEMVATPVWTQGASGDIGLGVEDGITYAAVRDNAFNEDGIYQYLADGAFGGVFGPVASPGAAVYQSVTVATGVVCWATSGKLGPLPQGVRCYRSGIPYDLSFVTSGFAGQLGGLDARGDIGAWGGGRVNGSGNLEGIVASWNLISGALRWSRTIDRVGTAGVNEQVNDVAVDSAGNVWVVGQEDQGGFAVGTFTRFSSGGGATNWFAYYSPGGNDAGYDSVLVLSDGAAVASGLSPSLPRLECREPSGSVRWARVVNSMGTALLGGLTLGGTNIVAVSGVSGLVVGVQKLNSATGLPLWTTSIPTSVGVVQPVEVLSDDRAVYVMYREGTSPKLVGFDVGSGATVLLPVDLGVANFVPGGLFRIGTKGILAYVSQGSGAAWVAKAYVMNKRPEIVGGVGPVNVMEDSFPVQRDVSSMFRDDDLLSYSLVGNSNPGLVSPNLVGTNLTLAFSANSNGTSVVRIRATDPSGLANTNALSVNVAPVNDRPTIAVTTVSVQMDEDGVWTPPSIIAGDMDDSPSNLTWSLATIPSNGVAIVSGSGSTPPIFQYRPNTNYFGADRLRIRVTDGGGLSATSLVNITVLQVLDPPRFRPAPPANISILEDGTWSFSGSIEDPDGPGDYFGLSSLSDDLVLVPSIIGSVSNRTNYTFQFAPAPDRFGSATVIWTVDDIGDLTGTATSTVQVVPVNDPPNLYGLFGFQGPMASDIGLIATQYVDFGLSQLGRYENDSVVEITTLPDKPALFSSITCGLDGVLRYTPSPHTSGVATVSMVYRDSGGTLNGGVDRNTNVIVFVMRRRPEAGNSVIRVGEDTPVLFNLPGVDRDSSIADWWITESPTNGVLMTNALPSVSWVGPTNWSGTNILRFRCRDSTGLESGAAGSVILAVTNINDPPVILGMPAGTATVGVAYNFTPGVADGDGDDVHTWLGGGDWLVCNTNTGVLTGVPSAADVGRSSVGLYVYDRMGANGILLFDVDVRSAATTGSTGATTGSTGATTGSSGATTGSSGATTGSSGATTASSGATTGSSGVTTGSSGVTTGSSGVTTGSSGCLAAAAGVLDWTMTVRKPKSSARVRWNPLRGFNLRGSILISDSISIEREAVVPVQFRLGLDRNFTNCGPVWNGMSKIGRLTKGRVAFLAKRVGQGESLESGDSVRIEVRATAPGSKFENLSSPTGLVQIIIR